MCRHNDILRIIHIVYCITCKLRTKKNDIWYMLYMTYDICAYIYVHISMQTSRLWFQHGDPTTTDWLPAQRISAARRQDLVQPKTRLALLELRAGLIRSDALCQTHAHRQIFCIYIYTIYILCKHIYNYIDIVILTVFYICDTKDDDLWIVVIEISNDGRKQLLFTLCEVPFRIGW